MSINAAIFNLSASAPPFATYPAYPTVAGFWFGSTNGVDFDTWFIWVPLDNLWHAIISP